MMQCTSYLYTAVLILIKLDIDIASNLPESYIYVAVEKLMSLFIL